jgi:zona occludens toxin (predicted ATPase)
MPPPSDTKDSKSKTTTTSSSPSDSEDKTSKNAASRNSNSDIWIAGAFAAFTVDLLVYPLDTIKTRMQSPDYKKLYTNGVDGKATRTMFRGVYQGIGSVILATLPSCTLLFFLWVVLLFFFD